MSTWAEKTAETLGGLAGDEDGCRGDCEGHGERDAARRLGRVVRRISRRRVGRSLGRSCARSLGSSSGRTLSRPLVMASCHTSTTTVALDELVEHAPCDDGVARSVGETEYLRSLRSRRFDGSESGVRLLRAACGV